MANIKPYTDQIANAVYGEEVRSSIINAVTKINDDNESYEPIKAEIKEVKEDIDNAQTTLTNIRNATTSASTTKSNLDDSIAKANTAKSNLDSSITSGTTAKSNLDGSISSGNTLKSALNTLNTNATATKNDLTSINSTASTTKTNLTSINNTASTTLTNLTSANAKGQEYITEWKAILDSGISHNSIYRGKFLGTSFTSAQQTAVANGTFDDMYIGDYWTINGVNWRICDFDYFYGIGDTAFTKHHIVIMPDSNILGGTGSGTWMNATDTTTGGYTGTQYRSTYRSQCKTLFTNAFGTAHIATHRELLCNVVTSGASSGWAWADADTELPSEENIYGHGVWGVSSLGGGSGNNVGVNHGQFALFRHGHKHIRNGGSYWLRNVCSSSGFAFVGDSGYANYTSASASWVGFRPYSVLI